MAQSRYEEEVLSTLPADIAMDIAVYTVESVISGTALPRHLVTYIRDTFGDLGDDYGDDNPGT